MNDPKLEEKRGDHINRHFKREGKWMVYLLIGLPVAFAIIAVVAGPFVLNAIHP
jgi:hypothetical protein